MKRCRLYGFDVITFAQAPPDIVAQGLECQVRAWDERKLFEKLGGEITLVP
jgi:hypothetical protein